MLNIIDDYNRACLYQEIDTCIGAYRVTKTLELLINDIGKPKAIRVDNGPEFTSVTFVRFCNKHWIELRYIQPGKPMENAFIERFNGFYRREVLDYGLFYSIIDLKEYSSDWCEHYNNTRSHDSLNGLSPNRFSKNNLIENENVNEFLNSGVFRQIQNV